MRRALALPVALFVVTLASACSVQPQYVYVRPPPDPRDIAYFLGKVGGYGDTWVRPQSFWGHDPRIGPGTGGYDPRNPGGRGGWHR